MYSLLPHISLLCLILLSNTALATSSQDQLPSPLTDKTPLYHIEGVVDVDEEGLEELLKNWDHEDQPLQITVLEEEEPQGLTMGPALGIVGGFASFMSGTVVVIGPASSDPRVALVGITLFVGGIAAVIVGTQFKNLTNFVKKLLPSS